jgi:LuxR family transcriptional regulator, quorum-sensing system regulator BjaR1
MTSGSRTMNYVGEAFEALDDIARSNDAGAVVATLSNLTSRFGFKAFLVTRMPRPGQRLESFVLLNGWPKAWYRRYMQQNHYRHDPIAAYCFGTTEPYRWSDVPFDSGPGSQAARVMGEAAEHGLEDGYCVPAHDASGNQACITMAGGKLDLPPDALRAIHLVALYAFGAARRSRAAESNPEGSVLSLREQEILRWTASGKSAWEVASILCIAERTVLAHLSNAKRKLGTCNGVHTVVEALRRREIEF